MEGGFLGLDLLVNNKKILKKNIDSKDDNKIMDNNISNIENDIKEKILNILESKSIEKSELENKDVELDKIIDNTINTLIELMKYKYYNKDIKN